MRGTCNYSVSLLTVFFYFDAVLLVAGECACKYRLSVSTDGLHSKLHVLCAASGLSDILT